MTNTWTRGRVTFKQTDHTTALVSVEPIGIVTEMKLDPAWTDFEIQKAAEAHETVRRARQDLGCDTDPKAEVEFAAERRAFWDRWFCADIHGDCEERARFADVMLAERDKRFPVIPTIPMPDVERKGFPPGYKIAASGYVRVANGVVDGVRQSAWAPVFQHPQNDGMATTDGTGRVIELELAEHDDVDRMNRENGMG